jgi:hypothetical protein
MASPHLAKGNKVLDTSGTQTLTIVFIPKEEVRVDAVDISLDGLHSSTPLNDDFLDLSSSQLKNLESLWKKSVGHSDGSLINTRLDESRKDISSSPTPLPLSSPSMEDVRLSPSHNSPVKDTSSVGNVIFPPSLNVVNLVDDSEGSLLEVESVEELASKAKPIKGRGGGHYLLRPCPPSLSQESSQSGGLGQDFFKESGVSKANRKSTFKLAQAKEAREVNQGKQSLIKGYLEQCTPPMELNHEDSLFKRERLRGSSQTISPQKFSSFSSS